MSGREPQGGLHPDLLDLDAEAGENAQPSPGLRAGVLASIAARSRLAGFGARLGRLFDLAAERASELIREAASDAASWVPYDVPGVRLFHLTGGPRVAAADCGLVRIEVGGRFPEHRHVGDEWTLVLAGEAEEEGTGERWTAGDLVHRPAGSRHAFRVTSREPYVFAVVLDGGIELG